LLRLQRTARGVYSAVNLIVDKRFDVSMLCADLQGSELGVLPCAYGAGSIEG
jgi:hypothetical protein